MPKLNPKEVKLLMDKALLTASQVVLGKEETLKLAFACILAKGHLLIEDLPGLGKTTMAHTLAQVFGLAFQRIQFTSDMLPADILGASIFNRQENSFEFHPGPIFSQVVLADEVNRATPKCQSALLEAMEERQVTTEGNTYPLPEPFFVVATQNPTHQIGTFPLPEAQMDRFLMRLTMGYPPRDAERALLAGKDRRDMVASLPQALAAPQLLAIQAAVGEVHVSEALLDYVQAVIEFTRQATRFSTGLSPRGGLALMRSAQAWALIHGRNHVLPEDVQSVMVATTVHRLQSGSGEQGVQNADALASQLLSVPIP